MSDQTCKQAGKVGGATTRDRYGVDYLRDLGRRGAEALNAGLTPAERRANATKGGEATRARLAVDDYERLGRLGGEKLKATRGRDYYVELGRRTQAKRRAAQEANSSRRPGDEA